MDAEAQRLAAEFPGLEFQVVWAVLAEAGGRPAEALPVLRELAAHVPGAAAAPGPSGGSAPQGGPGPGGAGQAALRAGATPWEPVKLTSRPSAAGGAPRAAAAPADLSAQLAAFSPYGRGRGRPQPQQSAGGWGQRGGHRGQPGGTGRGPPRQAPQPTAGGWGQKGGGTLAERFKASDTPADFGKRAPPPYRRKTRRQWWSPMRHKGHMRQVWSFPRRMAAQKPLTPSWKGVLVFKPPAA